MKRVIEALTVKETMEGAGVKLHRGFGYFEVPKFDPFLLFDDFSGENPADYLAGFPWHPHRGIETVTYLLDGAVRHKDSIGNAGVIGGGDIQWMTAGSGIIHEEMPEGTGGIKGFQLWVNLPKSHKMMRPRYQDIVAAHVPEVVTGQGAKVRVIAGKEGGVVGPVQDVIASPMYLDVSLEGGSGYQCQVVSGHTSFIYVVEGAVGVGDDHVVFPAGRIVLFDRAGEQVVVRAGTVGARFLLISGAPIGESVSWRGPIVMNTDQELRDAFTELREGTFLQR